MLVKGKHPLGQAVAAKPNVPRDACQREFARSAPLATLAIVHLHSS